MAYNFTKNTANYLRWSGFNTWVNNYVDAQRFAISVWFRVRTADSGTNNNRIISAAIASGNTGMALGVNSDGTVYAGFRSISTDAFEKHTSTRTVSIGGSEWNHLLVSVQFGGAGVIQIYLNGEFDSERTGISFGATGLTPTSQVTNYDYIGADAGGATPSSTALQFDGQIGEIAMWGIRFQMASLTHLLSRMAKRLWYNKITPVNMWTSISPYPYYPGILDPTVVGGMVGRQSATDPAALTTRANISNASGHPPAQSGIHWRYRNRKSLILPVSSGGIAGSATVTLGDATLVATGTLQIQGQVAGTLGALTSTAAGTVSLTGTASVTLGALTSTATGALAIQGTLTKTLDDATLAATGSLQATGSGAVAATLADATLSAAGALAIAGTTSATLAAATLASTGALAITGTTSATLDDATLAATGTLQATGSGAVAATLADVSLSATGTLANTGAATSTLDGLALSAAGALQIKGSTTVTLGDATLSAAGTAQDVTTGTLSATLADVTLSSSSTIAITGTVGATLADATLAATGELQGQGAGVTTATLDDATVTATGKLALAGAATITLDDLTGAATGVLPITGTATAQLAAATLVARIRPTADIEPDVNSAWWTYSIAADDLTFAIPADDLTYAVGADQLAY